MIGQSYGHIYTDENGNDTLNDEFYPLSVVSLFVSSVTNGSG